MKDEQVKLEEIEASHTPGGYRRCRCYSDVRYTIVNRSLRICCRVKGLVAKKTHGPVCMRKGGSWVWAWGGWCEYSRRTLLHKMLTKESTFFFLICKKRSDDKHEGYGHFWPPNLSVYASSAIGRSYAITSGRMEKMIHFCYFIRRNRTWSWSVTLLHQRSSFLHNRPVTADQQNTEQEPHGGDVITRCDALVFPDSTQATECASLTMVSRYHHALCLLLIDKTRPKDKTSKWVSVRWKTKNQIWGSYTPRIHWVARGTGTPKDRDEVNRREVCECDGW